MIRRLLIATVGAALVRPAPAALAHVELKSVSPRKNSTRTGSVREVSATFRSSLVTGIITIKNSTGHVITLTASGLKPGNKRVLRAVTRRSPLGGSCCSTCACCAQSPAGRSRPGATRSSGAAARPTATARAVPGAFA
jgi:methionine-rich copper-binding protein CopC